MYFHGKSGKPSKYNADQRKTIDNKRKPSNSFDNQMSEFDELELLCLPNFKQTDPLQAKQKRFCSAYPDNYDVKEYKNTETAEDRRKYRNSKDLRNNKLNDNLIGPDILFPKICFTHQRGQKCLDPTCEYIHEVRLPKKLRLCKGWKNGLCTGGQSCLYLHSEYPCLFYYLGLKNKGHDTKPCRYYHGGPLSKEYEEMFLASINTVHYPNAREMYTNQLKPAVCLEKCTPVPSEMYKNQITQLKPTVSNLVDGVEGELTTETNDISDYKSTNQQELQDTSITLEESVIEPSPETVVEKAVNARDLCKQEDYDSSDESCLHIDEEKPQTEPHTE